MLLYLFTPLAACLVFLIVWLVKLQWLWWMPLVLAGLAGPCWLLALYFRRHQHERRLAMMPE